MGGDEGEAPAPPPGDAAWRFAGHWYVVLGLGTIFSMPMSRRIDLGFVLYFWLAAALFRRGVWARRIVIGLCAGFLVFGAVFFISSALGRPARVTFFSVSVVDPAPDLAAIVLGFIALLTLPPAAALLGDDAKLLAGIPPEPREHKTYVVLYAGALILFLSGAYSIPRLVRRESIVLNGGSVVRGAGGEAWVVDATVRDGGAPPGAALDRVVFALGPGPRSTSLRVREGIFAVNGRELPLTPERSWVFLPPSRGQGPNVAILDELGQLRVLPRRARPADLPALEGAAAGFTDVEDLERRLLEALPPE